jgi:hypothetical protein
VIWKKFLTTFQRYSRARLTLHTRVVNEGRDEDAVRFVGQYVLRR